MFLKIGIGFLVGCSVAATGIGGGVILMPLLILALGLSPIVAVGTALSFMSVTKLLAALFHWKQKTVDFPLVAYLTLGSLPGAVAGSAGLRFLHSRIGEEVNPLLRTTIAATIIIIPLFSFAIERHNHAPPSTTILSQNSRRGVPWNAVWIGLAGGLLVSTTSVGSGSLMILLLLAYCPRSPAVLVGTDIFHGMILTMLAALLHLRLNRLDGHILAWLLLGAVGGVLTGVRITEKLAPTRLRELLLILAMLGGIAMLWRGFQQ